MRMVRFHEKWLELTKEYEYHVSNITDPGYGYLVLLICANVSPLSQRTTNIKSRKDWKKKKMLHAAAQT